MGWLSAYLNAGVATIRTRRGHDWTARFPTIARDMAALKVESAIIDGEAVVLDDAGKSSFAALQAALTRHGANNAAFYAFDLLFLNGEDLRENPLKRRRAALRKLIKPNSVILFSHKFAGDGSAIFRSACEYDLEGIVSKRLDSPYRSGKSKDWLKTNCVQSGAFVIIGYQPAVGFPRVPFALKPKFRVLWSSTMLLHCARYISARH